MVISANADDFITREEQYEVDEALQKTLITPLNVVFMSNVIKIWTNWVRFSCVCFMITWSLKEEKTIP